MEAVREERLQRIYSETWIKRLRSFVGRRYSEFADWEGWFEEAHQNLALKINNMPLEQEFSDALIFAVFKNELISVKRNRLGYPRPRAWLREFSELGQDLFEWMCLQKMSRKQVIEMAQKKAKMRAVDNQLAGTNAHDSSDASHQALLIEITDTMIKKKECDGVRPTTTDIDDASAQQIASASPSTEEHADHAQLGLMLSMILGADNVTDNVLQQASERFSELREALDAEPLLDDMDILILRCYYFQGMSQNEVAKQVSLPLQKVVRQRESAIKRIRTFMETHGITREAFDL